MLIVITGPAHTATHLAKALLFRTLTGTHHEGMPAEKPHDDGHLVIITTNLRCADWPKWIHECQPYIWELNPADTFFLKKARNWENLSRRLSPLLAADDLDLIAIADTTAYFYQNEAE